MERFRRNIVNEDAFVVFIFFQIKGKKKANQFFVFLFLVVQMYIAILAFSLALFFFLFLGDAMIDVNVRLCPTALITPTK